MRRGRITRGHRNRLASSRLPAHDAHFCTPLISPYEEGSSRGTEVPAFSRTPVPGVEHTSADYVRLEQKRRATLPTTHHPHHRYKRSPVRTPPQFIASVPTTPHPSTTPAMTPQPWNRTICNTDCATRASAQHIHSCTPMHAIHPARDSACNTHLSPVPTLGTSLPRKGNKLHGCCLLEGLPPLPLALHSYLQPRSYLYCTDKVPARGCERIEV